MSDELLSLGNVSLRLNATDVLEGVNLSVRRGEIVTLIGPNGAGKTSLVRIVLGLLKASGGKVWRQPRLRIGYMPQKLQIDPSLPLTVLRFLLLVPGTRRPAVEAALAEVGAEHLIARPLQQVSGGELQRILLARALLRQPDLLVLDEPVQGVDVNGQIELYQLITRLRDRYGCGVLMVSHDLHLVMATTNTVVCLNRHVCCSGHPEQVSLDPAFVAMFGEQASALAVYNHHHDHAHDLHGEVVPHEHSHGPDCKHA
ncbi:MAG: zinc ABC transporter ATP-binding protein ZnuC [Pseudomonadales bacterium]|jgi:zinc transport system ATP-binding protein|uniref:Zinc transport system ATP-binding protein n=1 Tax=Halopseudomonas aestusnigri TaxID=857252 RepID=A0AAQ1G9M7_9GAMM|nr:MULTISPECIES: zinc ABC transporter ATP-binding protein ZnuC [Halopseudomonas]MAH00684.1 zinc ABC transporter ATP-binding protein ZnuC [Pseudomonadales bacterium]MEE2798667.1 zinc ABC transporter ATP-binding protein ZnuC [Pseudomonadota bacterium]HBT57610.1 zinc ABC transporter ATP-binding protein ZnuC [Pseudomonas sp.]MAK72926.1 zinc ABC transporter ATP-binding protein ZnuC [Pseudomonadales bacterium]MAS67085.1 zinc ABC transporter ATP-binding protein ZnuC [Pseudomonadales bacterium]|tara:strand:- start:510 stop:1280 length:771 start_codon:yes stop_codon:yes gene_type:complete